MSQTLKAVRGTRDLLPAETALWNRIEATARSVFARYNFGEIRTPLFEDTALFARSVGPFEPGDCPYDPASAHKP
jgi:histidyl-tRNA synthetase